MSRATLPCPCCSGKALRQCCEPFLAGRAKPKTVKQVMRSRYSAFALGGFGEHLLRTWHASTAPALDATDLDDITAQWVRLDVLRSEQQADRGTVEFKAWFIDEHGNEQVHHETSDFTRERGSWFYVTGKVSPG